LRIAPLGCGAVNYQLRERLGRGGMGVVDRATDDQGHDVALKRLVLHGSAREMAQARQRVHREADALSRLDHPAVVKLIDVIDQGDEVVLVMPYLAGGTLSDHVNERGPLTPAQVNALADQLVDALAAAHRAGIVHRDIKPANVLFDGTGRAHLADFGVASIRDATSGLTLTGALIGTPDYMAPEQARGEPATSASDVFSLGATLLYAATGQPPYGRGDPRLTVQRAARGRLAGFPTDLDPDLRRRLAPMLRRDPSRRPTAAAAAGGPAGTLVAPPRPMRRIRLAALVGIVVLLAIGAGAAALLSARGVRLAVGTDEARAEPTSTTTPCSPKPYQPCGQPAAPFTDGSRCTADHADYDGDPRNGCEAGPDDVDGQTFTRDITANLVPADDVDRYPTPVVDNFHLTCDGTFEVTVTGPASTAVRVEVFRGGERLGTAVSTDGEPATVSLLEPNCFSDDSAQLVTQVSWEGAARSPDDYRLSRRGSF
jgi:hypothetical protein